MIDPFGVLRGAMPIETPATHCPQCKAEYRNVQHPTKPAGVFIQRLCDCHYVTVSSPEPPREQQPRDEFEERAARWLDEMTDVRRHDGVNYETLGALLARVTAETQQEKPMASGLTALLAELDPGIVRLVAWLNGHGFKTTDSGDGVTKPAAGDEDAEKVPHVYMRIQSTELIGEATRLFMLLAAEGVVPESGAIQASFDPADGIAILSVHGINDAMVFINHRHHD